MALKKEGSCVNLSWVGETWMNDDMITSVYFTLKKSFLRLKRIG